MCKYGKSDGIFGVFALEMKRRGMDYNLIDGASYGLSNMVVEMEPKGNGRKRAIHFKSVSATKGIAPGDYHWTYYYSQKEIDGVALLNENYDVQLGLFCCSPDVKDSDFVLVEHDDAFECLGIGVHRRGVRHVDVLQEPGRRGFWVYGTGRERAVRVPRDGIGEL